MAAPRVAADVAKNLFGANLAEQGRGYYVAIELFALMRASLDDGHEVLPPVDTDPMRLRLRSLDFARRLAGSDFPPRPEDVEAAFDRSETKDIVGGLVESLVVPVLGRIKAPTFKQRALFPYIGELIHYDAVDRRGRVVIERYTSRGAGGLAHMILRTDQDGARVARVRTGATKLVADSGSSLGRVIDALAVRDEAPPKTDWIDDEEAGATTHEVAGPTWPEALRAGVDRILQSDLAAARRVERLMHWIPYCIARHQSELAAREIGEMPADLPVDLRDGPSRLRSQARTVFDRQVLIVREALSRRAAAMAEGAESQTRREDLLALAMGRAWKSWTGFHSQTLAACGAINSTKGQRHYTAKSAFLEALVGATVEPGTTLPFGQLCTAFFERYGLVVDRTAADAAGLLRLIDADEFESNERALLSRFRNLGLLAEYSDQTRLVGSVPA